MLKLMVAVAVAVASNVYLLLISPKLLCLLVTVFPRS